MRNYWLSEHTEKQDQQDDTEDPTVSDSGRNEDLSDRQQKLYEVYEDIVDEFGQFRKDTSAEGSHYATSDNNPFIKEGLVCSNCVFYDNNSCEIVSGKIEPKGICKFWIIPEKTLKNYKKNIKMNDFAKSLFND